MQDLGVRAHFTSPCRFTRDSAGRITGKRETASGTVREWAYTYDTLGRLVSSTLDGELAESYAYDAQGNRVAYRAPARGIESTLPATFDAEDRLISLGDERYTYTADGFIAAKASAEGTQTYAYSALGELVGVTLADGREVTYTYDAAGRRTSRAVDGGITERYVWADATRLLAILDGSGALTARFLYADARTPYAADTPSGRLFLSYDQAGTLSAVTDEAGTQVASVVRDSFGNVLEATGEMPVPLGFAGGLADPDTGLVLFGARDYDPALGRWLARDPIGFAGGDVNLYGYCLGDPVGLVDPSGLMTQGQGIAGNLFVPGGGVSGSLLIVNDDKGHLGIAYSGGWYGSTGWGLGAQRQLQITSADTVCALQGDSWATGASVGKPVGVGPEVGAELTGPMKGPEYWGVNLFGGVGAGVPVESHASIERTGVVYTSWATIWDSVARSALPEAAWMIEGHL